MNEWLTVKEAADIAKRHPRTIADAARAKDLHASQRRVNASWRIRMGCLHSWIAGDLCEHQQANVTPIRRPMKAAQ